MDINIELLKTNSVYRKKVFKELNGDMFKFWGLMQKLIRS